MVLPGAADELADVWHERLKYRGRDADGRRHLIRYAGLGTWGDGTMARALSLAGAGIGAPVVGVAQGFLCMPWVEGRLIRRVDMVDSQFFSAVSAYLSRRTPLFGIGADVQIAPLLAMLHENTKEALAPNGRADPPGLATALRRLECLPAREAVIPDARLQAREWLLLDTTAATAALGDRTETPFIRYAKIDALDHGDDLRLPGPTDAAWDLAGATVEYALNAEAVEALGHACAQSTKQSRAELVAAVDAYRAPYAACHWGAAALAAREAHTPEDRRRFEREADRYRAFLIQELSRK
jgi:hypothetical protein